jgi:outer membrane protein TolC
MFGYCSIKEGFGVPYILAAAILINAAAAQIYSQTVFAPKLTLATAVEEALTNNPQTRASQISTKIAEAKIAEAKTGRQPFVQFTQGFTRSNNPVFVFGSLLEQGRFGAANFALTSLNNPGAINNFRSNIGVRAPLFDQRQTESKVSRAVIERKRVELQAEVVRQQLRFDVIHSYYGAILAAQLLEVTDEAVTSAKENARKTKDMVDVGLVAESDSLVAEVELANTEQQKLEAESNIITTLAALNVAIGNKPDAVSELTERLQEKYFPVEPQDELLRIAFDERPDYRQAQLVIDSSREEARSIKNQMLPRLDAFGNVGYSSPYIGGGSSDYTVGLSFSYTVFDPGRKARLEQYAGAESVAELDKEKLANQITLEVIGALQNFKTARSKIQVSIKSVNQSEEALRIIQDRYKFGLTTFNEVLRAETAVARSKQNLLTARYQYYVSYASILLATGRLTDVGTFG